MTSTSRQHLSAVACAAGVFAFLLVLARSQDTGGMAAIVHNVPLGVENKNAVLPSFDPSGRRTSLITADVIRRLDDERLYAEGFVLEQYSKEPGQNIRIDLSTAYYNMKTSMLRSTQRGKVSRGSYEIEGDSLIFDARTNKGLMLGNIRTVIFDTDGKSGE